MDQRDVVEAAAAWMARRRRRIAVALTIAVACWLVALALHPADPADVRTAIQGYLGIAGALATAFFMASLWRYRRRRQALKSGFRLTNCRVSQAVVHDVARLLVVLRDGQLLFQVATLQSSDRYLGERSVWVTGTGRGPYVLRFEKSRQLRLCRRPHTRRGDRYLRQWTDVPPLKQSV